MGERHQRVQRIEIALHRAVIGLERPEGQKDAGGDAVVRLSAPEDGGVVRRVPGAVLQPPGADDGAREFDEILLEHALRPVGAQHLRILAHAIEEAADKRRVIASACGFVGEPRDEAAEAAAALGKGEFGRERKREGGQKSAHRLLRFRTLSDPSRRETGGKRAKPKSFWEALRIV